MDSYKYYLAIDIGASSGRHILAHLEENRMVLVRPARWSWRWGWRNDMDFTRKIGRTGLASCSLRRVRRTSWISWYTWT